MKTVIKGFITIIIWLAFAPVYSQGFINYYGTYTGKILQSKEEWGNDVDKYTDSNKITITISEPNKINISYRIVSDAHVVGGDPNADMIHVSRIGNMNGTLKNDLTYEASGEENTIWTGGNHDGKPDKFPIQMTSSGKIVDDKVIGDYKKADQTFQGSFEVRKKGFVELKLIRGHFKLLRSIGGDWIEGSDELSMCMNDKIKTDDENTLVYMIFADGSIFKVKSNTILTLFAGGVQLQVGEVWYNLQKQGNTFQIVTSMCVSGVMGTEFSVRVEESGNTYVNLINGKVWIKDNKGKKIILEPGQSVKVTELGMENVAKIDTLEVRKKFESSDNPAFVESKPIFSSKILLFAGVGLVIITLIILIWIIVLRKSKRSKPPVIKSAETQPIPVLQKTAPVVVSAINEQRKDYRQPTLINSNDEMAFCIECGNKLESGMQFCHSCGTAIPIIEKAIITSEPLTKTEATPTVEKKYFLHNGQQQLGPFSFEELKIQKLVKQNMVWCEGMENWKPAGEVDELKVLFAYVPPPLPKIVSTPPPIVPTFIPAIVAEKKSKKKAIFIILVIILSSSLLIASVVFVVYKIKNNTDTVLKTDSLVPSVISDSANSLTNKDISMGNVNRENAATLTANKNVQQNNKAQNTQLQYDKQKEAAKLEAKKKEDEQKAMYRKKWKNYLTARVNYNTLPMGGITDVTVTLTNSLPYYVNDVSVWLNYILANGSTWRSEKVTFSKINANSTQTKSAPQCERGTSVSMRIGKATSNALQLYYSN
jgi:Na+-transporting methylmalonyl-CoA/oxaloacetate decarboxylase gamma subunit